MPRPMPSTTSSTISPVPAASSKCASSGARSSWRSARPRNSPVVHKLVVLRSGDGTVTMRHVGIALWIWVESADARAVFEDCRGRRDPGRDTDARGVRRAAAQELIDALAAVAAPDYHQPAQG